ncbi:hypothetical protein [Phenylobacterium sp. J367]|uniref:hypothetical protein n=1 Tax=Phenylobacterium sp. J367 TaxID=2898435 RepID=UPI002150FD97|nr:hypothetical protein [Phenylobacterium sp. J367]MCR5880273.1 hypothetical protein [Phenylobacterium sp. J367]
MEDLFRSYWWLLFPLGFFIFGAWDRWLVYRRSRDHLDLLRSFTDQGKEPPPELLRTIREAALDDDDDDDWGYRGRRYRHDRRMRRWHRYSPYWAWRTFFVTGAVALGFWLASRYADIPGTEGPFELVAIIVGCVALGHLAVALFSTGFRGR